ncbi:TonB-dependent receptor [Marivirga sp. S37H4]|uniref:TonB-dependent receptor n=1 Tax=Marivirga aurantiaca TaxID=2802615 RepID=A0A935C4Z9_9BACT|nr:TonB-dependent receptor [Marivirga aurantiaca]MBK6263576.1 TonB-dependent receptor [Marivirga aurantiaca]
MRFLLFTLLSLVQVAASVAQFTFSGHVTDAHSKEPLIGAHIIFPASIDQSTISDETGFFKIANMKEGDTLIISYTGYTEKIVQVKAKEVPRKLMLAPKHLKLKEVSVRASVLGAENFSFIKLKPINIYQNPNSKADPLVAVNTSVSSTTKDENAAVSFRGASPNQTGYVLNGVPLKNPVKYAQLTNTGTLSIFNTDFLKSVTVFPGNPPLEYGQSTSGTIVLEMADRFPDYWQHTASVSMANTGYSLRGPLGKRTFLGLFANYQFDKAIKAVNPKNFENINAFKSFDGAIMLSSHQKKGSVKFYQYGLWDQYNFQFRHPSYQSGFLQEAVRSISTLQWIREVADWQITAVLGNSFTNNQFNFGNLNYKETNLDPYGAVHLTQLKGNNLLKIGYSYWFQKKSLSGGFPNYDYALAPEHPSVTLTGNQQLAIHEAYSFYRKKLQNHSFGAGIRLGYSPEIEEELYSYQLNYLWKFHPQIKIKAGVGRYYQLRNTENNRLIIAHQSSIDVSFKQNKIAIDQSFYYNFRGSTANTKGLETTFSYHPNTQLQIDQSFSLISGLHKTNQWFTRSFLIYKPFESWSVNASYQSFRGDEVSLITSALFNNDLNVFNPANPKTSLAFNPYHNFSMGVNRLFSLGEKANGIIFLSMANLFDVKNSHSLTYNFDYTAYDRNYLSRRSIYAGIVLNFIN